MVATFHRGAFRLRWVRIFGAADSYLNAGVARRFHDLLPTSELFLPSGARHYVQLDEPAKVAQLILGVSARRSS
jgi:pimeloyl-ACP methyl ester carboxylesterase